jgi:hypothetical protein
MPISYTIDKTRRYVHTTVAGAISVTEILEHLEAARQQQFLAYSELIDTRGVTPPYLSASEIWRAAESVLASSAEVKFAPRAVVVPGDIVFGMVRMFAGFLSGHLPMEVFRELKKAEEWLISCPAIDKGG